MKILSYPKQALILLLSISLMSCSVKDTCKSKVQETSPTDSIRMVIYDQFDTPEMSAERKSFGSDLTGKDLENYKERKLSKSEIKKWMLHMNAVHGMTIDDNSKAQFLNGKWTMYRLDTVEHRLVTLERNTSIRR